MFLDQKMFSNFFLYPIFLTQNVLNTNFLEPTFFGPLGPILNL